MTQSSALIRRYSSFKASEELHIHGYSLTNNHPSPKERFQISEKCYVMYKSPRDKTEMHHKNGDQMTSDDSSEHVTVPLPSCYNVKIITTTLNMAAK